MTKPDRKALLRHLGFVICSGFWFRTSSLCPRLLDRQRRVRRQLAHKRPGVVVEGLRHAHPVLADVLVVHRPGVDRDLLERDRAEGALVALAALAGAFEG